MKLSAIEFSQWGSWRYLACLEETKNEEKSIAECG